MDECFIGSVKFLIQCRSKSWYNTSGSWTHNPWFTSLKLWPLDYSGQVGCPELNCISMLNVLYKDWCQLLVGSLSKIKEKLYGKRKGHGKKSSQFVLVLFWWVYHIPTMSCWAALCIVGWKGFKDVTLLYQ